MLALIAASLLAAAPNASQAFKAGQKAEKAGRMVEAYLLYSQAAALDPTNGAYWRKSLALRTRAAMQARPLPRATSIGPHSPFPDELVEQKPEFDSITEQDWADARKPQPPAELRADATRRDWNLKVNAQAAFEQVARAYGLDCVFDGEYEGDKPIVFRVTDAGYREALRALELATGSFIVPLAPKLFLVVKDTPQKRQEQEPASSIIVSLSEVTNPQDLTALVGSVQQSLGVEKTAFTAQRNAVVMRDRLSKILPARIMLEQLMLPRPEIALDVEFLEVNRTDALAWGLDLPNLFRFYYLGGILRSTAGVPSDVGSLITFGGGRTLFGFGIGSAEAVARMSKSDSRTLLQAQMRALSGTPAQLHIGDKYPIVQGGFFGAVSGPGQVYTPPPAFTFEDLGLNIKVTPRVHSIDDVTLEFESEFKVLGGEVLNGIPVISTRKLASQVRLKFGEWGIASGLMSVSEARAISGIYGLSSIPYLGALMRSNNNDKERREVLLLLRPRLLRLPPDQVVTMPLRIGSDTRPLTPL